MYHILKDYYIKKGKPEKILEVYRKGIQANDEDVTLLLELAYYYHFKDERKEAESIYKRVIDKDN